MHWKLNRNYLEQMLSRQQSRMAPRNKSLALQSVNICKAFIHLIQEMLPKRNKMKRIHLFKCQKKPKQMNNKMCMHSIKKHTHTNMRSSLSLKMLALVRMIRIISINPMQCTGRITIHSTRIAVINQHELQFRIKKKKWKERDHIQRIKWYTTHMFYKIQHKFIPSHFSSTALQRRLKL